MQNFQVEPSYREALNAKNYQTAQNQQNPIYPEINKIAHKMDDRPYGEPIELGLDKKNRKRMWEYDWTLLIPETHKEVGSMF